MGLFQRPLGSVDLVLHQILFCASLHLLAGMSLLLFGHQFPLYGLVDFRHLALVVDDGSTQLARTSFPVPLARGLTNRRRHPFARILSLRFCGTGVCPKLCRPFQRLRISPACGQLSSIIISLCCPKNLTFVLLRSVRYKKAVRRALGRIVFVWRYCALSPIFLLCFPSRVFLLSIHSMQGFSVGAVSFSCLMVRC